tara:strand:+ start:1143 stop:2456 length:1314 start_codon:yes stop_codon:yes gene_type:complete
MNLLSIKKIYYSLPQFVKWPLQFLPFYIFAGKDYRETKRLLSKYNLLNSEEKLDFSRNFALNKINDYILNVPFYRTWAQQNTIKEITSIEQLKEFPIIDKKIVMDNPLMFKHDKARGLYEISTAGTSGKPLKFFHTPSCYGKEWAFLDNLVSPYGVKIDSKNYSLRGVDVINADDKISHNYLYNELIISPSAISPTKISNIIQQLEKFNAQWIHCYPSTLYLLAKALKEKGLRLPMLKNALLASEQLFSFQKDLIHSVFDINLISFYGMSERVVFAEFKDDIFLPHPLYGLSELIDGEHVASGFINDGTCLLRYRTGDKLKGVVNRSGFLDSFTEFDGRWKGSHLVGESGEMINMTVLNTHCKLLDSIQLFQFRQSKKGECLLLLKPNNEFDPNDELLIKNFFQTKLGNGFNLQTKLVSEIERSSRDKHQFIISELN